MLGGAATTHNDSHHYEVQLLTCLIVANAYLLHVLYCLLFSRVQRREHDVTSSRFQDTGVMTSRSDRGASSSTAKTRKSAACASTHMPGDDAASQPGFPAQQGGSRNEARTLLHTGSTSTTNNRTNSKHTRKAGSIGKAVPAGDQAASATPSTSSSSSSSSSCASKLCVSNIQLAAAVATANEGRSMVAALVHTLFKHGLGGYAVGLMQQQPQQEKLLLLSRLRQVDLAAVLAAPQPQQVLDAVHGLHQGHASV
jgi:hypothetical protein